MTPERLAAIKERLKNLKELPAGPWLYSRQYSNHYVVSRENEIVLSRNQPPDSVRPVLFAFIAHSRQDVADLVSEVERLQFELADYQERERDSDRVISNVMKNLQGD